MVGGGADLVGSLPLGIPFPIIRLGRGQTLFFCRRLYLKKKKKKKAVSGDGFQSPCARPLPGGTLELWPHMTQGLMSW